MLVVAVVAGVGIQAARVWWKLEQIPEAEVAALEEPEDDEAPKNFLIVGSDSREVIDSTDPNAALFTGDGADPVGRRADTMVLLRFDEDEQKLDVMSIPRDLWVPISGTGGSERINTAYAGEDGPNTLVATLQDNLGIPIHHYAEVDFKGFQDLVDELGGVDMYFNSVYQDLNSGLVVSNPGCISLDGHMALAFVRSRHLEYLDVAGQWQSDPTGDLGRITRQQLFLRNALAKAKGRLSVTQLSDVPSLIDVAIDHVTIDTRLGPDELLYMMQRYAEFEGDSIETHTLPTEAWTTNGGAAVLRMLEAPAQPVLDVFRGDENERTDPTDPDEPTETVVPADASLVILNGSGVQGQAGDARELFERAGFEVTEVGDVFRPEGENLEVTVIHHAPGDESTASLVLRHLTGGGQIEVDSSLSAGELVVETGIDYTTVRSEPGPLPSTSTTSTTVAPSTTSSITTTTLPVGKTPGEPPDGVECG